LFLDFVGFLHGLIVITRYLAQSCGFFLGTLCICLVDT